MNNKTNTPAIDREKLRATIQERLECVKDELLEVDHDSQTRAYLDGQIYVLERLISDIDFGLWAGYDHAAAELRWIPVSERLPELGDCYMTTQDLEDGEGVMSWPLHYESKTKKWFQDIDHKEPFDHPVLAWQERPKPYTEPADNIGEELHVIDYATGNCNLGCCKGEPECSHPMAERVGLSPVDRSEKCLKCGLVMRDI